MLHHIASDDDTARGCHLLSFFLVMASFFLSQRSQQSPAYYNIYYSFIFYTNNKFSNTFISFIIFLFFNYKTFSPFTIL